MPTYVYRCQHCGALIERRQSFHDAPLTRCEICLGELRRVLHPVGVIFRGSGFYSTDHRADAGRRDGKPALTEPGEERDPAKPSVPTEAAGSSPPPSAGSAKTD